MRQTYREITEDAPKLKRGLVQCRTCRKIVKVDSASCLRNGWPKCHGFTMTLDVGE